VCAYLCVCVRGGGIHAGNHGDGEVLRLIRGTHTEGSGKCGQGVCVQLSVHGREAMDQTMC